MNKVLIIAEAGVNHNGDINNAFKMSPCMFFLHIHIYTAYTNDL